MSDIKHSLGQEAEDLVTGVRGILTARATYFTGCDQYCIKQPVKKDGSVPDGYWIDESRVKIIGEGIILDTNEDDEDGGPAEDTPKI